MATESRRQYCYATDGDRWNSLAKKPATTRKVKFADGGMLIYRYRPSKTLEKISDRVSRV